MRINITPAPQQCSHVDNGACGNCQRRIRAPRLFSRDLAPLAFLFIKKPHDGQTQYPSLQWPNYPVRINSLPTSNPRVR